MSGYPKTLPTFNKVAPPSNYVAGIGRGAMGFTTRSDIGPAAGAPPAPSFGQPPPGYVAGRGMSGFGAGGAAAAAMNPQFGQAPAGYVAGRGRAMGALARDQNEMSSKQRKRKKIVGTTVRVIMMRFRVMGRICLRAMRTMKMMQKPIVSTTKSTSTWKVVTRGDRSSRC